MLIYWCVSFLNNATTQRFPSKQRNASLLNNANCDIWYHIFTDLSKGLLSLCPSPTIYRLASMHCTHVCFFQALYLHSKSRNREFLLRIFYMEIYNEIITDLLNPKLSNLRVRKNTDKEISVEKLTEKVVTSVDEVIDVMRLGEKNRHIGCTNMNEKSSRLRTMFRMVSVIILRYFNLKILTTD